MDNDFDATHEANKAFCRNLAVKFPALAPILNKNLEDEDGDLNTYLFASAVIEWAEANVVSREAEVVQLLAALNQGLAEGEREVPNFIAVGFGESISHKTPLLPLLRGDLKGWYEFDFGISENHPVLRSGN